MIVGYKHEASALDSTLDSYRKLEQTVIHAKVDQLAQTIWNVFAKRGYHVNGELQREAAWAVMLKFREHNFFMVREITKENLTLVVVTQIAGLNESVQQFTIPRSLLALSQGEMASHARKLAYAHHAKLRKNEEEHYLQEVAVAHRQLEIAAHRYENSVNRAKTKGYNNV